MGGACSTKGKKRYAYRILVGEPEVKGPLGRARRRSVYNIKTDLRELFWDGMDWINVGQDRGQRMALLNIVINFQVP
jgi:hypothetical protein